MKTNILTLILLVSISSLFAQGKKELTLTTKEATDSTGSVKSNFAKSLDRKDSTIYLKQDKQDYLRFKEIDEGVDGATVTALLAILISILAIYLPIRLNNRADRKSTFFKLYEYWNTDYMLKERRRFWQVLREQEADKHKISLKLLYEKNQDDYYTYEAVYDVLSAIARLYDQNEIDRRLVKSLMITFVRSYGNILEDCFVFHQSSNSFFTKMSEDFYSPVRLLKNEICQNEVKSYALFKELDEGSSSQSESNDAPH